MSVLGTTKHSSCNQCIVSVLTLGNKGILYYCIVNKARPLSTGNSAHGNKRELYTRRPPQQYHESAYQEDL